MRTARAFVPAFRAGVIVTLSGAVYGPGDKVAFHPEAGSSVQKSYSLTGDYSLDEMSVVADGQDLGGMLGSFELSISHENLIEVTDVFATLSEGRPSKLERTFDALTGSVKISVSGPMPESGDQDMKSSSPLEGKAVVFQWNEEKGEFDVRFSEDGGEEELLEGLVEDMDLRVFLPSAEVAKGDTWSVALEELHVLYMPGGDLSMEPEGMDIDEESTEMFEQLFSDFGEKFSNQFEGECSCTYVGSREEDGLRLAEIALDIEVDATFDLSELIMKAIEGVTKTTGAELPDVSLDTADLNLGFDGAGTLLWNLQAGRMHSFQLQGDATIGVDLAVSVEVEGANHALDASLEMSGTLREEIGTKE